MLAVGGVAQLGEHLLCKQGVVGSIPSASTIWVSPLGVAFGCFEAGGSGCVMGWIPIGSFGIVRGADASAWFWLIW